MIPRDRVVILTGATQGIGRATAYVLAEAGCKLVLATRSVEPLQTLADELTAAGHQAAAGGRADRGGGVSVGKSHALAGEPVDVGRLVQIGPIAAQIGPAQVVHQDEHEVGPLRRRFTGLPCLSGQA